MPLKKRLDRLIVERGLAQTREKAQALVMAGLVTVDGHPATKAGVPVAETLSIEIKPGGLAYVGRGGVKLEGAARHFGIQVDGLVCADIGSSTGGFTQFLLRNGAARIFAVDVDVKQLDWNVRQDPRVVTVEKNARFLEPADLGEPVSLVTIDVSFISMTLILPRVTSLLTRGGACIALVKPQFEVGRERVGKGGIVRDPEDWRLAVEKCVGCGIQSGLTFIGQVESPIPGREGNREFFVYFHNS